MALATGLWLCGRPGQAGPPAAADSAGLRAPIDATWSGLSLGTVIGRLNERSDRPIVIDRRIDPGARIERQCRGEPFDEVLAAVAGSAGGELAILRCSIRIVPAGDATVVRRAEAARERRIATLPAAARRRLSEKRGWSWPDGARPRDLVAATAAEAGVTLEGLDSLPHDHFPRASLPPLPLADRLDLLLAHFDRRIDWEFGPQEPRATAAPNGSGDRRLVGRLIAIEEGAADEKVAENERPDASRAVASKPAASKPAAPPATFSLRAEATLEKLLPAIANRLGLAVEIDRDSLRARGISAGEIVRVDVADASRDALLDAVLDPLGLEWSIEGRRLRVFAPAAAASR